MSKQWCVVCEGKVYGSQREAQIETGLKKGFRKVMRVYRVVKRDGESVDCVMIEGGMFMPVDRERPAFKRKDAERFEEVTEEYVARNLQDGALGARWIKICGEPKTEKGVELRDVIRWTEKGWYTVTVCRLRQ